VYTRIYRQKKIANTMNIGIIGSGNIGSLLARQLVALGHQVAIANKRGPQSLEAFAMETGVIPVTVEEVVRDKDIVVMAVPQESIQHLPRDLFSRAADGTIVVDAGNYYPGVRDAQILAIDAGMRESEWVSQQLAIPIIKAFNNIMVGSLATRPLPHGTSGRVCLSVAGDSSDDKKVIIELIDQLGFVGIDAGLLADSWRQQPGSPAYCMDLDVEQLSTALQEAEPEKIDQYRMNAMSAARRAVAEAGSLTAAMANAGK
jgi:predicted dinucleotide-binding enzyme